MTIYHANEWPATRAPLPSAWPKTPQAEPKTMSCHPLSSASRSSDRGLMLALGCRPISADLCGREGALVGQSCARPPAHRPVSARVRLARPLAPLIYPISSWPPPTRATQLGGRLVAASWGRNRADCSQRAPGRALSTNWRPILALRRPSVCLLWPGQAAHPPLPQAHTG